MHFSIIQYLLTSVCIVSLINITLIYKLSTGTVFSHLLRFFNYYLFFHATYVIAIEQFFSKELWLDRYAPFGLMYGPFLYFAFIAVSDREIPIQKVILHSFPFILFLVGFIYIVLLDGSSSFSILYYNVLNLVTVASFVSYTIMAMFLNVAPSENHFGQKKLMILSGIIILLFVTIITITAVFSSQKIIDKPSAVVLLRGMIYSCMLMVTILIFKYKINIIFFKIHNVTDLVKADKLDLRPVLEQPAKYEKSTLSTKQLDEYGKKLEKLMLSQKVYLETDLSLQKLAQKLRIPNHHLTQVLSLKMKMSFYDYINALRVQYACVLLDNEPQANLENIAERSGFNSKVSFNRHFKSILECTPSDYRSQKRAETNA